MNPMRAAGSATLKPVPPTWPAGASCLGRLVPINNTRGTPRGSPRAP